MTHPTDAELEAMAQYAEGPNNPDASECAAMLRACKGRVRVKPLEWDFDGRKLRMDDTMLFSKGYDWDAYECFRQEGYGTGSSYIIWPDKIVGSTWNLYGTRDGLFITDLKDDEAAKAAAQADYEAAPDQGERPINWRDDPDAVVEDDEPQIGRDYA